jgi:glycolate oxidase FAD binding subunit
VRAEIGSLTSGRFAELADAVKRAATDRTGLFPRGAATWWPHAPPNAIPLNLAGHRDLRGFDAADLVATVGAGCPREKLARLLAEQGTWIALDPPGSQSRTLGSMLATGGPGPLSALYGPPRDQVLGLTVLCGNGTIVRLGGRVVKNVAGFDLAKLVIGGHGGFGMILEADLRLRAVAEADHTRVFAGGRADMVRLTARLLATGAMPAALEVTDPALSARLGLAEWTVALRAIGTAPGVEEELEQAARVARESGGVEELPGGDGRARSYGDPRTTPHATKPTSSRERESALWQAWGAIVGSWPVLLRMGVEPASWQDAVALAAEHLGDLEGVSISVPRGTVRVGVPEVCAEAARSFRERAARRGWPVTLERADAATLAGVAVWGSLPGRAEAIARRLREVFDPNGVFAVPLFA